MPFLQGILVDLRYAVRSLRRDRGFTVAALLIFALCFGANIVLLAIVNAVLIRPLPFPDAGALVTVYNRYPKAGVDRAGCSVPYYLEWRNGVGAFAAAAVFREGDRTLNDNGAPERVPAMSATPSLFRVLGVDAALGRTFRDDEATAGNDRVAILSDGLWREKFGGDREIVGRTVSLDGGAPVTVIGVMPPGFRILSSRARMWTPLVFSTDDQKAEQRHSNNLTMIARLRRGATIAAAQAQLDALIASSAAIDPYAKLVADAGFSTVIADLHADYVAKTRPVVLLLQAGVLLLLLIGLVNVANLSLVRATGRVKDLSLRQVLGATSAQLARQVITESVLLATAGALAGLATAWVAMRGLNGVGLERLARSGEFTLDPTVCATAVAAALVVGVLLALPVLWHTRRAHLASSLATESRGGTTSRSTHRLRHALIAAQIALAFVLLASTGLLGLSFARVLAVDPGFDPASVVTASVTLPRTRYADTKSRVAFVEQLLREMQAMPAPGAASVSSLLPFTGDTDINAVTVEGHRLAPGESLKAHYMGGVAGDYFHVLHIPLKEGRFLTHEDMARQARVCVIDEVVAQTYWPGRSALGGRIHQGVAKPDVEPFTVVGVVGAIKQEDLVDQRRSGAVYLPFSHYAPRALALAVRSPVPAAAVSALRAAVRRVDPTLPLSEAKPMALLVAESLEQRRSPLILSCVFAGLALLLVAIGLYGVLAYAVSQRRREIGVRMALGAEPANIRAQFVSVGARLTATGILIGGMAAWWSGRALHGLLYGVSPGHPGILAATVLVIAAITMLASLFPAAKAARVTPMEALRSD